MPTKITAAQAVATAKGMVGMPYWYACSGQTPTTKVIHHT